MKISKKNIKRIHIDGGSDMQGKIRFEIFAPLKQRKISSTWFPQLLGVGGFATKGDKLLDFYGLTEKETFQNFYTLRGAIAEDLLESILKAKGYTVKRFTKEDNDYDYFQYDEGGNKLYKYFGGLPDLVSEKNGIVELYEVKSKDMSDLKKIEQEPPEYEIMQGKDLAFLYGLDKVSMVWFLFSDDVMRKMYLSVESSSPFNLETAVKNFREKLPTLKYNVDYKIIRKDYTINKREILEQLKDVYKYAETFRQTLTIDIKDLSKEMYRDIFKLEKEIEDELRGN